MLLLNVVEFYRQDKVYYLKEYFIKMPFLINSQLQSTVYVAWFNLILRLGNVYCYIMQDLSRKLKTDYTKFRWPTMQVRKGAYLMSGTVQVREGAYLM